MKKVIGYTLLTILIVFIVFFLILHTNPFGTNKGVNIYIRNYIEREYILRMKFHDENGELLKKLAIPVQNQRIPTAHYSATFDYTGGFNAEFKRFGMQLELLTVPEGKRIARKLAFWPSEAGIPDGAGSNRIAVEIGIREKDGEVMIDLGGIL